MSLGDTIVRIVKITLISLPFTALTYGFMGYGYFFEGIARFLGHASGSGHRAYLMGMHSNSGWWYYYGAAFLFKTPMVILIALAVRAAACRMMPFNSKSEAILWIPIVVLLMAASGNRVHLGLRLILPLYPLLYVALGRLATLEFFKNGKGLLIGLAALAWYIAASLSNHPHYLSAFNEGIPQEQAHEYLCDSNLDWGQDLPKLGQYVREKNADVILLAYFGWAPPGYYGVRYQHLPTGDPKKDALARSGGMSVSFSAGSPRLLAISVTLLKGVPFKNHALYSWLEEREPVDRIGHSILVYDISGDRGASEELIRIYEEQEYPAFAEHEKRILQELKEPIP